MNKKEMENASLGITYQMSLDAFLKETNTYYLQIEPMYEQALQMLTMIKTCRSRTRKVNIAKEAIAMCEDCVEAYIAYGLYQDDIFETILIYKEGMERATMNLGKSFFLQRKTDFYGEETHAFFHMKFAYACALFDAGFMRKALLQFEEILAFNPSDVLQVRYYVYCLYLHFEEFEKFKEVYERFSTQDTFSKFAYFLYVYKRQYVIEAKNMLPLLYKQNSWLYEIISNERMNTYMITKEYTSGSEEEAAFCFAILKRVIENVSFLPSFMVGVKKC